MLRLSSAQVLRIKEELRNLKDRKGSSLGTAHLAIEDFVKAIWDITIPPPKHQEEEW
jgi:hypothetical protein